MDPKSDEPGCSSMLCDVQTSKTSQFEFVCVVLWSFLYLHVFLLSTRVFWIRSALSCRRFCVSSVLLHEFAAHLWFDLKYVCSFLHLLQPQFIELSQIWIFWVWAGGVVLWHLLTICCVRRNSPSQEKLGEMFTWTQTWINTILGVKGQGRSRTQPACSPEAHGIHYFWHKHPSTCGWTDFSLCSKLTKWKIKMMINTVITFYFKMLCLLTDMDINPVTPRVLLFYFQESIAD